MAINLPNLNKNFLELGILPSSYLLDWILPLYAKVLNPDLVSRIWDILFIEGDQILLKASIGKYLV